MSKYRERLQDDYDLLRAEFRIKAGLGPNDVIDDWIREGLMKYSIVNHNIQGCIMARTSVATKIKVLKRLIADFGQ
jgi:hypothetical protein